MVDFFLGESQDIPLEGELTNFAELTRGTTQTFRVVVDASTDYNSVISLVEYAGASIAGTTFDAVPWYREFLPSQGPTTLVKPLYPSDSLDAQGVPGIWGLIVGGEDSTTIQGSQGEINLDIFVLAPFDDFATKADVANAFEVDP